MCGRRDSFRTALFYTDGRAERVLRAAALRHEPREASKAEARLCAERHSLKSEFASSQPKHPIPSLGAVGPAAWPSEPARVRVGAGCRVGRNVSEHSGGLVATRQR